MIKNIKSQKGITMVSLVATIVVMLILAAVTITASVGDNGLLNRATSAKNAYDNSTQTEESDFNEVEHKMQDIKSKHQVSTTVE